MTMMIIRVGSFIEGTLLRRGSLSHKVDAEYDDSSKLSGNKEEVLHQPSSVLADNNRQPRPTAGAETRISSDNPRTRRKDPIMVFNNSKNKILPRPLESASK
jgi:hypothetical protein